MTHFHPRPASSLAFAGLAILVAANVALGQAASPKATTAPEAAVRAASQAYKDALLKGDGKTVASLWTADGDIIDDLGTVTLGRDAAAGLTPAVAGDERPAFAIGDVAVRMIAETVAIEDGTVEVTPPGSSVPHHGRFSATWVRQADGWKLAGLREWRTDPADSAARLADLEWLVGDWDVEVNAARANAGPAPKTEMSVRWNSTRTYLLRETRITPADGGEGAVVSQRIGWDPLSRQIHSWAFSSDGGHSEAVWSLEEGNWVARTTTVHPDGSQTSATNHYHFDGKDECTFQSFPTHAGAEQVAPVTMTMTRKPGGITE
jgi:hypothetical protein